VLTVKRRQLVFEALKAAETMGVAELADRFGVSEMTIRRDLDALAANGRLARVHGGAVIAPRDEAPFTEKAVERQAVKAAIGAKAAAMVEPGDTIFADVGTTVLMFARHLHGREITVITSNMAIYEELVNDPAIELILLGGLVRRNYKSLVGFLAEEALRQLHADKAFMGASGLGDDLSVMDSTMVEVPIKRGMIASASQSILLIDSAKFRAKGLARAYNAAELNTVVTDKKAPADVVSALEERGVRVVKA
jgi:DeoR/GlpR family transcriptional regulator of sugar metabolism